MEASSTNLRGKGPAMYHRGMKTKEIAKSAEAQGECALLHRPDGSPK